MVAMGQQGTWIRWAKALEWVEVWKVEPHQIKVLVPAVYDMLSSPSNLHTWGKAETPACLLCSKRGTGRGAIQVLKVTAETISAAVEWSKWSRPQNRPSPSPELCTT